MKTIAELFSADWAHALGWTLFHSLWQSLLVLVIVLIARRVVPGKFSSIRYAVASAGLLLFMITVAWTFLSLLGGRETPGLLIGPNTNTEDAAVPTIPAATGMDDALPAIASFINANMPLILACWLAGFLFSLSRVTGGIYLTCKLRSAALPVENRWADYVKEAARQLGIRRLVSLAESASVSAPLVIGYMKPVIIVPAGMLTGLSSEQLETIFIHELAHIKRHDYLINLIQSVVEMIFFFNPFTRILSHLIRTEREYCCDDFVLRQHGSAKAYANALARLAEVRLLTPGFALPLAEGKSQLLNRIKRIMEQSVQNHSIRARVVFPALLLAAGLLCVSWLGVNPGNRFQRDLLSDQDTLKKNHKKGARYSRKRIVTIDENGQPHEKIVEQFDGDEELRPLMALPDIPGVPPAPVVPVIPPVPDIGTQRIPDTIPPPQFPFNHEDEWEHLSKSMEQMRKMLEDISGFHEEDVFKSLEEFGDRFQSSDWPAPFLHDSTVFENLENQFERLREFELEDLEQRLEHFREFDLKGSEQLERLQGFELRGLEKQLERLQDVELERLERQLERLQGPLRDIEKDVRLRETALRKFEQRLRKELIEDGYLSEKEAIETMEWDDHSFKINGKEIRERDSAKYRELRKKFEE